MQKSNSLLKYSVVFLLLISLTSCVTIIKRGYSLDEKDLANIKDNVTTKENLLKTLDYPTMVNVYPTKELWIYYSYNVRKFLFLKPKIVEAKLITFELKKNTVILTRRYDLEDMRKIKPSLAETRIDNKEPGLIRDLFHNIGKVTPSI